MKSVAEKKKHLSRASHNRVRVVHRPSFPITGILAGIVGSVVISVIIEVSLGRPQQVIMLISGMIGLFVGAVVETLRYGWRLWRWKVARDKAQLAAEDKP